MIFILTLFKSQNISTKNILISGLFFSGLGTIWLFLKPVFIRVKELSELQYEGARFMRNYQIFKTVLTAGNKVRLPQSAILLGNKDSNKVLTVITNPFCSPCKDVHEIVSSILKVNSEEIQINIIVNADIDDVTEENQTLLRLLIAIFMQKGESLYLKAMYDWYEMQNIEQWTKKYFVSYDSNFIDNIYKLHKEWCLENNFNATPSIFINGYKYPKTYPRKNLQFFINDIIEDEFVEENINIESKETAILYS